MLSIIVLNYNRLHLTKKIISNLIKKTTVRHEFIFVDNGGLPEMRAYLKSLKGNTRAVNEYCVFNKYNFGVAGGRNIGLVNAHGEYLMTIDDDVLVPDNYDRYLIEACDKIKKLGITGINVEGKQYPIQKINGVSVQLKKDNLGGGCLCLPRRTFNKVGYFASDFLYGGEDLDMHMRMRRLGLIGAYILPSGKHIDDRANKQYEEYKKRAHKNGSVQVEKVVDNIKKYVRVGTVYVPYVQPKRNSV